MPRWPLEKSPQPLSGYITLHIGHITGREGVALQGPRQGVALAPEKNDVTRFHIVLSGAHFSSGAKVLCDKGDIACSQVSVSLTRGRGLLQFSVANRSHPQRRKLLKVLPKLASF